MTLFSIIYSTHHKYCPSCDGDANPIRLVAAVVSEGLHFNGWTVLASPCKMVMKRPVYVADMWYTTKLIAAKFANSHIFPTLYASCALTNCLEKTGELWYYVSGLLFVHGICMWP